MTANKKPPPQDGPPPPADDDLHTLRETQGDLAILRETEKELREFIGQYMQPQVRGVFDQRLLETAQTQIELGFLALYRAIETPKEN